MADQNPRPRRPGTLPTTMPPPVRNPDGSYSTVRTISIGTPEGEVLIPTVINGKVVTNPEAIQHWRRTGEDFGAFRTPNEATGYANWLHQLHENIMNPPRKK